MKFLRNKIASQPKEINSQSGCNFFSACSNIRCCHTILSSEQLGFKYLG